MTLLGVPTPPLPRRDPAARGIYLRKNTYWLAQQRNRKRVFVSLETSDYSEAIRRAAEIRKAPQLNEGGLIKTEISRYLTHKGGAREFTRNTARNAQGFLARLAAMLGDLRPDEVTQAEAQRFYNSLRGMRESSSQTYVAHARSFFRWCVKVEHLCRVNPFDEIKMPNMVQVARKEFCAPALRDQLLDRCPRDDLKFILLCGFHAGLRRNEIVEARPEWFDLQGKILHLRKILEPEAVKRGLDPFDLKDQEERSIPLSKAFATFLSGWLRAEDDYCLGPGVRRGRARYRYDFIRFFRDYMAEQNCRWVTPHTMRRTFASLQVSRGTSIYLVSRWLGDDIRTTTRHYGHLLPTHKELEKGL